MQKHFRFLAIAAMIGVSGFAHAAAASLTSTGYTENFNSMGTSGTVPPSGWTFFTGNSGTSHSTWDATTSIPANGSNSVASMVATTSGLTATSSPSGTKANGFNAAISSGNTADRVLATSPTSISGSALQLTLTNNTGYSFSSLLVSYDTVRFTTVTSGKEEELPGYWLFSSLDGTNWTNVSALNPTLATVPNSKGVTSVSNATFSLGSTVAAGGSLYLRWVDDNGIPTSPDQIIGLNNVSIAASVPEPETYALMMAGLGFVGFMARRRNRLAK